MKDADSRLSITDLATIELMRTDSDYARYCEGVDDRVDTAITAKFSKDSGACTAVESPWMPRLIAHRAKLFCEEVLSIPVDRRLDQIRDWLFGLGWLGLAVLGFSAATTAFFGPHLFFDEHKNANISSLLLLMLIMFLVSLISTAGMVVMLVQWFRSTYRSNSSETRCPTIVLRCIWWLLERLRQLMNLIYRRETGPPGDSMRSFKELTNRQSYFASAVSLLAINAYMLLFTCAIWGALIIYLLTDNVGYEFRSSLTSPAQRSSIVNWFGKPVRWIGISSPDTSAVAWSEGSYVFDECLFVRKNDDGDVLRDKDGELVRWLDDEITSYKNRRYGEFRNQWSLFLVGCVLMWLIAPRILVLLICGICVKCFKRDLLPRAEDEGVRKIVDHVIGSGEIAVSHTDTPHRPDTLPNLPATLPSLSPSEPESRVLAPKIQPTREPQSTISPTQLKPRGFRVVGYELEDASYDRLSELARHLKTAKVDPNLNGAREQMAFAGELDSNDRVVVVASLLTTADDSFQEFLEDVGRIAAVKVVLTDGAAAREEYKEQPSAYDMSLQAWKTTIRQTGINENDILAHDLSNDQGVSLAASALDAREFASDESGIVIAGRYEAAVKIVHRHVNSLLSTHPMSQAVALQNLDDELSRLYVSEKRSLTDRLKQLQPTQRIQDELSKVKLPSDFSGLCVRAAGVVYGSLLNRLPTRWAMAGGLSGLAVGAVGGLAALASGGSAVLPMFLPIIVGHTISGAGIGGGFKLWLDRNASQTGASEPSQYDQTSDDVTLARCGVIQTLIYELQGNSESAISEEIDRVTSRLDRIDPQTTERLLTNFAGEMKEMEGRR